MQARVRVWNSVRAVDLRRIFGHKKLWSARAGMRGLFWKARLGLATLLFLFFLLPGAEKGVLAFCCWKYDRSRFVRFFCSRRMWNGNGVVWCCLAFCLSVWKLRPLLFLPYLLEYIKNIHTIVDTSCSPQPRVPLYRA